MIQPGLQTLITRSDLGMSKILRQKRSRQRGFTLVELMVSLVVLALMMQMMLGGLRFGTRVWERVSETAEQVDQVVTTQRFLRNQLNELSQPNRTQQGQGNQVQWWFSGKRSEMTFVAPWRLAYSYTGMYRFRLWIERGGDTSALHVSWHPDTETKLSAADLKALSGERVLLTDVADFDLSYYGALHVDEEARWAPQWTNSARTPNLVRINVSFGSKDKFWPETVIASHH